MARPARVTPEDIERAAVDLVRAGGLTALTARAVADHLGVSTQPVYSSWGSMDALRTRVDQRVTEFIQNYLAQPESGAPPLLSWGCVRCAWPPRSRTFSISRRPGCAISSPALPRRRSSRR